MWLSGANCVNRYFMRPWLFWRQDLVNIDIACPLLEKRLNIGARLRRGEDRYDLAVL